MALVAALLLAGCSEPPPIAEQEFIRRMESLDGVASAELSLESPMFGTDYHVASVGVTSDLVRPQLQAIFDELIAMPAFDRYEIYEEREAVSGNGVSWDGERQDLTENAFVVAMWPDAASLPDGTEVTLSGGSDASVQLWWRKDVDPEPSSDIREAMRFANIVSEADDSARLSMDPPSFNFYGVPSECERWDNAVEAILSSAVVTWLEVNCTNGGKEIEAIVEREQSSALKSIEDFIDDMGFDFGFTTEEGLPKDSAPAGVMSDTAAVGNASLAIPGAPQGWSTSTGIVFEGTDEQTARTLLGTISSMAEFERISFCVGVRGATTDKAFTIAKGAGEPMNADALFALGEHPAVGYLWAQTGSDGTARHRLEVEATSVEEAVSILHSTGVQDVPGLTLTVAVVVQDAIAAHATIVTQDGGTAALLDNAEGTAEQRFLDVWNAA